MMLLVLPSKLLFHSRAFQWILVLLVFDPRISSVVKITLEFMVKLAGYSSLATSPSTYGVKLSVLRLFLCKISVIGLLPTVLLVTTLNMCASIKMEIGMVLLKYKSSLNSTALLSILLVKIAVINVALQKEPIELLLTVSMPNLLVPILTFVSGHIALIILSVYSMHTPVQVWILFVLKLLLATIIT